jgi:hypothetical protein
MEVNPALYNPFQEVRGYADGRRKIVIEELVAWVLVQLMQAGMEGCTPAGLMMPGLSQFIYQLRKAGVKIETIRTNEPDAGDGLRLRYVLRSEIAITELVLTKALRYAA